jgi:hypothetical protein
MDHHRSPVRLTPIGSVLAAFVASALMIATARAAPQDAKPAMANGPELARHKHDWDWLVGSWTVRHRRLKTRLASSTDWEEFNGTSRVWLTLGGLGTVDDNVLELPGGTYGGVGLRAFDPKASQWLIWWLDGRNSTELEPPVRGSFQDGVGTFVGDDTLNGRKIKMRFRWSKITPTSAHWEQAFSADDGATWETNWTMEFTRVRP